MEGSKSITVSFPTVVLNVPPNLLDFSVVLSGLFQCHHGEACVSCCVFARDPSGKGRELSFLLGNKTDYSLISWLNDWLIGVVADISLPVPVN